MAKNLLIVESPAKTRTLSRFLGKDFDIMATIGHVIDLPKSKLGIDVKKSFAPQYTVIEGKEKVLKELKAAAKKAKTVYLAPDPDREGEAIAWHVAEHLKEGKDGTKANIVRVTFNEITKSAVSEALTHPREIDMNLVNAQQARRVLDRLVGYTVSPFLWKTVARNLSAGRVQSVALRLICEREQEIAGFKPQEYWTIEAVLKTSKKEEFIARLFKIDDKTVVSANEAGNGKVVIESQKEADKHLTALKQEDYVVAEIKKSQRSRKALAPFITSTLQQEAAKACGFSPKMTMSLAQKLYEGIEIGKDGPVGLITYMRTDSTRISDEALTAVRDYIGKEYGKKYLPSTPNVFAKKKAAQDAHEAIRPTYLTNPPEAVKKELSKNEFRLYELIWNRFIACQMTPAEFDVETVDISAGKYTFRVTSQRLTFDGFLKVYHEEQEADENAKDGEVDKLPPLKEKEKLSLKELKPNQSFTKPPPRYSEAMLVKRLESDGIGRPSTYAAIISTLKDRKYVDLKEKKLYPSELGNAVNKILVEHFDNYFNVSFTSEMEQQLDLVEEGTTDWAKMMKNFYGPFNTTINDLKKHEKSIKESMTEVTDESCEKCGSPMVIKWGRNGRFLACSAYPDCKSTKPLPGEEEQTKTNEVCEKCSSPMVVKTGRFGKFLACSGYPECKNTKALTLGIPCPKPDCGGQVVQRQSKGKRIFYGCSNYPKCDFVSWDMPVKKPCPACKNSWVVAKSSKAKGDYFKCPECGHTFSEEPTPQPEPTAV